MQNKLYKFYLFIILHILLKNTVRTDEVTTTLSSHLTDESETPGSIEPSFASEKTTLEQSSSISVDTSIISSTLVMEATELPVTITSSDTLIIDTAAVPGTYTTLIYNTIFTTYTTTSVSLDTTQLTSTFAITNNILDTIQTGSTYTTDEVQQITTTINTIFTLVPIDTTKVISITTDVIETTHVATTTNSLTENTSIINSITTDETTTPAEYISKHFTETFITDSTSILTTESDTSITPEISKFKPTTPSLTDTVTFYPSKASKTLPFVASTSRVISTTAISTDTTNLNSISTVIDLVKKTTSILTPAVITNETTLPIVFADTTNGTPNDGVTSELTTTVDTTKKVDIETKNIADTTKLVTTTEKDTDVTSTEYDDEYYYSTVTSSINTQSMIYFEYSSTTTNFDLSSVIYTVSINPEYSTTLLDLSSPVGTSTVNIANISSLSSVSQITSTSSSSTSSSTTSILSSQTSISTSSSTFSTTTTKSTVAPYVASAVVKNGLTLTLSTELTNILGKSEDAQSAAEKSTIVKLKAELAENILTGFKQKGFQVTAVKNIVFTIIASNVRRRQTSGSKVSTDFTLEFSTGAQDTDTTQLTTTVLAALSTTTIASPSGVESIAPNENATATVIVTINSLAHKIETFTSIYFLIIFFAHALFNNFN